MKGIRLGRIRKWFAGCLVLAVIGNLCISHPFPAWTHGPKTSVEILELVFVAPTRASKDLSSRIIGRAERDAVKWFPSSCDLPDVVQRPQAGLDDGRRDVRASHDGRDYAPKK